MPNRPDQPNIPFKLSDQADLDPFDATFKEIALSMRAQFAADQERFRERQRQKEEAERCHAEAYALWIANETRLADELLASGGAFSSLSPPVLEAALRAGRAIHIGPNHRSVIRPADLPDGDPGAIVLVRHWLKFRAPRNGKIPLCQVRNLVGFWSELPWLEKLLPMEAMSAALGQAGFPVIDPAKKPRRSRWTISFGPDDLMTSRLKMSDVALLDLGWFGKRLSFQQCWSSRRFGGLVPPPLVAAVSLPSFLEHPFDGGER
jgi:hypothetical protein